MNAITSAHVAQDTTTMLIGDDAEADLKATVRAIQGREGLTQRKLAQAIGIAPSTLSEWLNGTYKGDEDAVRKLVSAWIEARQDATSRAVAAMSDFVETPTSEKICAALAYAKSAADMVCIYGGPGVGKTRAIAYFRAKYPTAVWVATMTPASSGLVSALEVVGEAVGLAECTGGARRVSNAIRKQVAGSHGLIIIDEAQHLSMAAIEELRSIHDATGIGLALVGNETSYARLTGGSRAASYAQIFSRIGMRLFVHRPDRGDVRAIADAMGVTDADAIDFMARMAARPGALRGMLKALRLVLGQSGPQGVTVESLRAACHLLGAEV